MQTRRRRNERLAPGLSLGSEERDPGRGDQRAEGINQGKSKQAEQETRSRPHGAEPGHCPVPRAGSRVKPREGVWLEGF